MGIHVPGFGKCVCSLEHSPLRNVCRHRNADIYSLLCLFPGSKTLFLLGPSHHETRWDCRITQFSEYETPLGNLVVDTDTSEKLRKDNKDFISVMEEADDIREHSLEMHLPYIYKMLSRFDPPAQLQLSMQCGRMIGSLLTLFPTDQDI